MAFQYSPKIITDGLVFLMDFKNKKSYQGTGTSVTDIVNNKIGTISNGATYDGDLGILFDGLDDQIALGSITSTDALSLSDNTGDSMTFDIWMNATSGGDPYQRIIDKSNGGSAANGWAITRPISNVEEGFLFFMAGVLRFQTNGSSCYNFGDWVNIVVTCDIINTTNNYNSIGYINGTFINTYNTFSAPSSDPTTTTNAVIGSWHNNTGREFNGTISRITIYNRALTASEILQNYKATKSRFGL
jgi:hypothetical protein